MTWMRNKLDRLFLTDYDLAIGLIIAMLLVVYVFACWLTRHMA